MASLLAVTALAQTAPTPPAAAPAPKAEGDTLKLDTFVTTGSSIRRADSEKVLPVTVFNRETIEARDSTTSLDLLMAIPQITNIPANETPTNAVASRGGNAAAALRGIGAENTLVLFNGRRVPINPISVLPAISTVNINTLPTVGLTQIEVLRDGASAIYGADAVAGVINYITNNDQRGGTTQLRYGVTEHGGGMDIQGVVNFGTDFAKGRGRWVTTVSAYYRDAIYLREREISASSNRMDRARGPWAVTGSVYDGRSATSQWTSFRLGANAVTGTVNWLYPVTGTTPSLTATALPRSLYADYNQYTTGQPSTQRYSVFNRVEFDVTPSITAFAEFLGYQSASRTGRQPITLTVSDARVTLGVDNPYNPYGSAFNAVGGDGITKVNRAPQAITVNSVLMMDGGPEEILATDRMYRLLGGLKGSLGTSTWNWETAAVLGGYRITDDAVNSIRESLLKQAALRSTTDAWNPFGYTFKVASGAVVVDQPYTNPANVRDYYTDSAKRIGHSKLASLDFRLNGEVLDLWAGPISAAVGAEWRYELKSDWKPAYVSMNPDGDTTTEAGNNDILVMSPKYNYTASRTVASAYAETVVPLVAPKNGVPFINYLEANASLRFESYSDFGETTKPKFGLNYRPFKWLMARASYNQGFHAPDLTTMNQAASFTVASPPGNRDTVRNNYFTGAGLAADVQVLNKTYTLPSPNLQPEESEGISAGLVVDVPGVKGLSASIDYWEIEQKNLIFSQTRDAAIDASLLLAYTQQQLAAGKSILAIDVGSRTTADGAHNYVGDPYTLRAAVTPDDIARFQATYAILPQSQWIAPVGQWLGATTQSVNGTGKAFTNGFDYELDYSLPKTSFGQFRLTTTWSQFLNKFRKDNPTDPQDDDIVAMLLPEWKSSTTLQWRLGAWGASFNATYQSDIRTNAQTNAAGYAAAGSPSYIKVVRNNGSVFYYEEGQDQLQLNLGFSYDFGRENKVKWLRDTKVRLGINNVLDEEPALIAATDAGTAANVTGYTGATGTSLWVGRAYSLTVNRSF